MQRVGGEAAPPRQSRSDAAWLDRAFATMSDPARAARAWRADAPRRAVDMLTTRETAAHAVRGALNPARLRRFVRRLTS